MDSFYLKISPAFSSNPYPSHKKAAGNEHTKNFIIGGTGFLAGGAMLTSYDIFFHRREKVDEFKKSYEFLLKPENKERIDSLIKDRKKLDITEDILKDRKKFSSFLIKNGDLEAINAKNIAKIFAKNSLVVTAFSLAVTGLAVVLNGLYKLTNNSQKG